jgi:hypothetical protein
VADSGFPSSAGVVYRVKAVQDAPPVVALRRDSVSQRQDIPADALLVLNGSAEDDLGVRKLILRYAIEGKPTRDEDFSPRRPLEKLQRPMTLDLRRLGAKPGDVLTCELRAEDVLSPTPNITASSQLQITIAAREHEREPAEPEKPETKRTEKQTLGPKDPRPSTPTAPKEPSEPARNDRIQPPDDPFKELVEDLKKTTPTGQHTPDQDNLTDTTIAPREAADGQNESERDTAAANPNDPAKNGQPPDKNGEGADQTGQGNQAGQDQDAANKKQGQEGEGKGEGQGEGQGEGKGEGQGEGKGEGKGKGGGGTAGEGKGAKGSSTSQSGDQSRGDPGNGTSPGGGDKGEATSERLGEDTGAGAGGGKGEGKGEPSTPSNPGAGQPGTGSGGGAASGSGGSGGGGNSGGGLPGELPSPKEPKPAEVAAKEREAMVKGLDKNRALTQQDREKMEAEAQRQAGNTDPQKRPLNQDPRQGVIKGGLTKSASLDRSKIEGRQDDFKEDPVSRLIQEGQAKVAPEYREALADYYKAVSK